MTPQPNNRHNSGSSSGNRGCLAGLLIALLKALMGVKETGGEIGAYRRKDYLFSKAERSFYEVLQRAVAGEEYVIFAKVRLCDLVYVASGEGRASALNRIISKHVDFVLCDREKYQPQLVIELDDASHQRKDRQQRDAFLDAVLAKAGLPVLHVPCKQAYPINELRQAIAGKLRAESTPDGSGARS